MIRLLHVGSLELKVFHGDLPQYATLSHTWRDEEVTLQDIVSGDYRTKKGWGKILGAVGESKKYHCEYLWVDTCCIDKSSSAELLESINSIFRWYRKCKVCFAYLDDIPHESDDESDDISSVSRASVWSLPPSSPPVCFEKARWFQRGWTLQELIAPKILYFNDV